MRALLIFSILLLISIIAIEGGRRGKKRGSKKRYRKQKTFAKGSPKMKQGRQRSAPFRPPKQKKGKKFDPDLDISMDILNSGLGREGFAAQASLPDVDYYDTNLGSGQGLEPFSARGVSPRFGKPLEPIRRNTGPSKNMVAASTNMRKVIEDLLQKYDGSKPLLVGVPYPVVYEIPARRNQPQPRPQNHDYSLPSIQDHRPLYSSHRPPPPRLDYLEPPNDPLPPQHSRPTYSNPQRLPTIPARRPTYSNPPSLPPRSDYSEPPIPARRLTYSNPRPQPPAQNIYPELGLDYDPLLLEDGYSEEEVDGSSQGLGNSGDNFDSIHPLDVYGNTIDPRDRNSFRDRDPRDPNHSPTPNNRREAERRLENNNQRYDSEEYQDDPPPLIRPPPPGARENRQYRNEPRKSRVNTKVIGPVGHPGKPPKGFSGNAGVRTLDISEYEDSREYPKYRPAEREYGPEYPPPDRSRQYTDPREYGPEEF